MFFVWSKFIDFTGEAFKECCYSKGEIHLLLSYVLFKNSFFQIPFSYDITCFNCSFEEKFVLGFLSRFSYQHEVSFDANGYVIAECTNDSI